MSTLGNAMEKFAQAKPRLFFWLTTILSVLITFSYYPLSFDPAGYTFFIVIDFLLFGICSYLHFGDKLFMTAVLGLGGGALGILARLFMDQAYSSTGVVFDLPTIFLTIAISAGAGVIVHAVMILIGKIPTKKGKDSDLPKRVQ